MESKSKFTLIKDSISSFFEKQFQNLKSIFNPKKEKEIKDNHNKLTRELDRINPIIEDAGYLIRETRLSIGLPPFIELYLHKSKRHTKKTFEELIQENQSDKTAVLILNALQKASEVQGNTKIGKQTFEEIVITLGIPPRVSLRYLHEDFNDEEHL